MVDLDTNDTCKLNSFLFLAMLVGLDVLRVSLKRMIAGVLTTSIQSEQRPRSLIQVIQDNIFRWNAARSAIRSFNTHHTRKCVKSRLD